MGLQITPVMITYAQSIEHQRPKRGLSRAERTSRIQASPERTAALKAGRERLSKAIEFRNNGEATLTTLRLRAQLSQSELASRMNMQQPNVARMEKKPGDLTMSRLVALSNALGVEIGDVVAAVQATAKCIREDNV